MSQAAGGQAALVRFKQEPFDLVLTDQKMPGLSGLQVLEGVRAMTPETAVIIMTAYGTIETAVSAIKAGAADYLTKPLNLDELLHRIHRVRERQHLLSENRELREALAERHRVDGIIGESGPMQEALSLVRRVAPSDATVLIRGESGTGKELIAKAIHYASARAAGPLVKVNCAALAESLLEAEMFGHEKGAFTGAIATRKGRFELAEGGSLFLDEIGDLPAHVQVKLLRVLQEREFERVGSSRPITVNVRLLAATHRDLEVLVRDGRFRDDLYYRINVVTVTLPPLRERRDDLPLLIDHFVRTFAAKNSKPIDGLTRRRARPCCVTTIPATCEAREPDRARRGADARRGHRRRRPALDAARSRSRAGRFGSRRRGRGARATDDPRGAGQVGWCPDTGRGAPRNQRASASLQIEEVRAAAVTPKVPLGCVCLGWGRGASAAAHRGRQPADSARLARGTSIADQASRKRLSILRVCARRKSCPSSVGSG